MNKRNKTLNLKSYILNLQGGQALRHNRGQAAIIAVLFFVAVMLVLVVGSAGTALKEVSTSRSNVFGKQGYFLSEAGQEDAIFRIFTGKPIGSGFSLLLGGNTATTTIVDVASDRKDVISLGSAGKNIRKTLVTLLIGEGASFVYGVQVGDGGLLMENSSSVAGNVYANGPVEGRNSNIVRGEVISAGPGGLINDVHATSSAYAHTISNSFIEGDAYYQNISNTTVLGELFPGSSDQQTQPLPFTDEMVTDWEESAEAGGVIDCGGLSEYEIREDIALGPVKINCDVEISGSPTVTFMGNVWIVGNLEIKNTAILRADASVGNKSIVIVADNPANRITSSKIKMDNSSKFYGSGQAGSYLLFLSQNNSAEQGGSERAIEIGNKVNGDIILYAGHGEILLQNNVFLREVTAYRVHLKNTAAVEYNAGLRNLLFSTGPSGSFQIIDWKEIE